MDALAALKLADPICHRSIGTTVFRHADQQFLMHLDGITLLSTPVDHRLLASFIWKMM
jgi:hypothetical protein